MKIILTENQIRQIISEESNVDIGAIQNLVYNSIGNLGSAGGFGGHFGPNFSIHSGGGFLSNGSPVQNMSSDEVAQKIQNRLMRDLGWTDYQSAALLGIIQCESEFNIAAVNRQEKAGTYAGSAANGAGYGAGLIQWSLGRKEKALNMLRQYKLSHGIARTPESIEECDLDDQITMIELELKNGNLDNLVRQTKDVREALKVLYTYFVAGWNPNATEIPSDEKVAALAARYTRIGGGDGFGKRLSAAQNFC